MQRLLVSIWVLCASAAAEERMPEVTPIPWSGGEISYGKETVRVLPPSVLPELQALVPPIPDKRNAAAEYFAAFRAFKRPDEKQLAALSTLDARNELLLKHLDENEESIRLLDAAAAKPDARWPPTWSGIQMQRRNIWRR